MSYALRALPKVDPFLGPPRWAWWSEWSTLNGKLVLVIGHEHRKVWKTREGPRRTAASLMRQRRIDGIEIVEIP